MTKIQMATLPAATVLPGIIAGVGHKILIRDDILIQVFNTRHCFCCRY